MKKYISPIAKNIEFKFEGLIAVSGEGGVGDGGKTGRNYTSTDVSYSNERKSSIWGDED